MRSGGPVGGGGHLAADPLVTYLEQFRSRALQDALAEALPDYWLRRAEMFRWAKRRPGERLGSETTDEQVAKRDEVLEALAVECERRAVVRSELTTDWWIELIKEMVRGTAQG